VQYISRKIDDHKIDDVRTLKKDMDNQNKSGISVRWFSYNNNSTLNL
jgi:hypothetical protein